MATSLPFGNQHLIVGRQRERVQLRDLLDDAIAGHGSLVLLSGEAGIGKTTLVNDLVSSARDSGALVLTGGCYDLTTTPPYGPWSEALSDYQPRENQPRVPTWFGDPDALGQVGSQTALFEETRRFFAVIAEHQPLVIVLEDLHWADAATLEALRYLARSLDESAILLVATYRDDELTRRHELYQLLPLLVRESPAQRIHLQQLGRNDVRELVARHYKLDKPDLERLVEHVSDRSEGNPFFVEEILQGLEDGRVLQLMYDEWTLGNLDRARVPMLLRQTLDVRLARLSQAARSALRVAAVIGHIVPIEIWQAVVDPEGDVFDDAMTAALDEHVLEEIPTSGRLQFRHALLREALYESLTLSRRRMWHRTVGEVLSEIPNADPNTVAHHFQESGDDRAAHWLIRAGLRAEGSYALRVAAHHYAQAQSLLASDPDSTQARGWLLLHLGHLLRYSDQERGIAYLEDAAQVARQVSDPLLDAQSQRNQGLLRCYLGEVGRGLAEMENANTIMESVTVAQAERSRLAIGSLFPDAMLSDPRVSPGGGSFVKIGSLPGINVDLHTYVVWLALAGRFRDAMRIGESFVDQVTAATDNVLLIQNSCRDAYCGLAIAADWLGRPEEARRWRTLALAAYETIGHRELVRYVHRHELEHLLAYHPDRIADRRRVAFAASAEIEGRGSWHGVVLDLLEGRWDTAREVARQTLSEHEPASPILRLRTYNVLGREGHDEQCTATMWSDIDDVLAQGSETEPGPDQRNSLMDSVMALQVAAALTLDAGNLEAAHAWIAALDHWLDWSGAILGRAESQLLWARFHRLVDDPDEARQHATQALAYATEPRQPLALIAAQRVLGQLALEASRYDEAAEHLQASLELAGRCQAPYEQALTLLELAELAARTDDIEEVRRVLRQARSICEQLGAKRSLAHADQIEDSLSKSATAHPAGISAREVEVLEHAATGMTNAEIGETLYISPRTVAQHLRSVYNKLGVNSRTAAVTRWAELKSS